MTYNLERHIPSDLRSQRANQATWQDCLFNHKDYVVATTGNLLRPNTYPTNIQYSESKTAALIPSASKDVNQDLNMFIGRIYFDARRDLESCFPVILSNYANIVEYVARHPKLEGIDTVVEEAMNFIGQEINEVYTSKTREINDIGSWIRNTSPEILNAMQAALVSAWVRTAGEGVLKLNTLGVERIQWVCSEEGVKKVNGRGDKDEIAQELVGNFESKLTEIIDGLAKQYQEEGRRLMGR